VTRWNRRLLFGAIALLVPALAGCEAGLQRAHAEFHPASNGVSVVDGINIDNAFVLGPALNSTLPAGGQAGVFVAGGAEQRPARVGHRAGRRELGADHRRADHLNPDNLVDLSGPAPQIVLTGLTNSLSGGETIQLVLTLRHRGRGHADVPVEPRAYDLRDLLTAAGGRRTPSSVAGGQAQEEGQRGRVELRPAPRRQPVGHAVGWAGRGNQAPFGQKDFLERKRGFTSGY
jgi:hypothetical protein